MIKNIIKILWIFLAVIVLACVTVFFSIAKGWIGYMPPVEDLENPNYKFATQIFSEDGKVLGIILEHPYKFYRKLLKRHTLSSEMPHLNG